ncbi:hypothetical protein A2U01_0105364, partial [Trifolium medium]|nr:hypothetical protein [Trifolium medium]
MTNTGIPDDHLACSRTTLPSLFCASISCPSATPRNSGKEGSSSQSKYRPSRTKTRTS